MGNYGDFRRFIEEECRHEVIYRDTEGRDILVLDLLDAYYMMDKWQEYIKEKSNVS